MGEAYRINPTIFKCRLYTNLIGSFFINNDRRRSESEPSHALARPRKTGRSRAPSEAPEKNRGFSPRVLPLPKLPIASQHIPLRNHPLQLAEICPVHHRN